MNSDAGGAILRNCLYLLPVGPLAYAAGLTGPAFACGVSVATGIFAMTAAVFFKVCIHAQDMQQDAASRSGLLFRVSLYCLEDVPGIGRSDSCPTCVEMKLGCRSLAILLLWRSFEQACCTFQQSWLHCCWTGYL